MECWTKNDEIKLLKYHTFDISSFFFLSWSSFETVPDQIYHVIHVIRLGYDWIEYHGFVVTLRPSASYHSSSKG